MKSPVALPIVRTKRLLISPDLKKNNLDILRFLLALTVIYSHCFVIYYGTQEGTEPMMVFSHNQAELGGMAVFGFFMISGFLILRSFEHNTSFISYLRKRLLRIVPGFFAAYLLSMLVLAPLSTVDAAYRFWKIKQYFAIFKEGEFLTRLFTLQAPVVTMGFESLHLPHMINEPLWTIQYELICYLLIPLAVLATGLLRRRWVAFLLFAVAYAVTAMQDLGQYFMWEQYQGTLLSHPVYLPKFWMYFMAGSCIYLYRNVIVRSTLLAALAALAIIGAAVAGVGLQLVLPVAGIYLLFYIAFHPGIRLYDFGKRGDFSYGLYLYGWPVQQFVMYLLGHHLNVHTLFLLTLPFAGIAAYMSWHLIEKPFLRLKEMRFLGKAPVAAG